MTGLILGVSLLVLVGAHIFAIRHWSKKVA